MTNKDAEYQRRSKMKETFEPLVIWGDGFSTLYSWFRHCATPESCYELIKGVVEGDPDRQLVLEDPLKKNSSLGHILRRVLSILLCLQKRTARA